MSRAEGFAGFPDAAASWAALTARAHRAERDYANRSGGVSLRERLYPYSFNDDVVPPFHSVVSSHATGSVFTGGAGRDKLGKGRGASVLAPASPQAPGGVLTGQGECHPREPHGTRETGISPCKEA